MQLKKMFLCGIISFTLPFSAYAVDITVSNDTDTHGTIKLVNSILCSSLAGASGIAPPRDGNGPGKLIVSQSTLDSLCAGSCKARVYPNKNCSGSEVAIVSIHQKDGVTKIDPTSGARYIIEGNGSMITMRDAKKGLMEWIKSLL